MKVKRESEVAQSCPTLRDPMDGSPPGSSVCGIEENFKAEFLSSEELPGFFAPDLEWLRELEY